MLNEREEAILEALTDNAIEDGTLEEWAPVHNLLRRLDVAAYPAYDHDLVDYLDIPDEPPEDGTGTWVFMPPMSRGAFEHLFYMLVHLADHEGCDDATNQILAWADGAMAVVKTAIMDKEEADDY